MLSQAGAVEDLGFTLEHLNELHDILGREAAGQGISPTEGIEQFFAAVARYGAIISWEMASMHAQTKAKQAQAEAKRWQAEARHRRSRLPRLLRLLGGGEQD